MSSEDPFDSPGEESYDEPRYTITGRIMILAIIVLVLAVWLVFSLHVYARWIWRQPARFSRRRRSRSAPGRLRFHFTGQEPSRLRNVGLDSAILGTLPMFVYKSQNFEDGLECAVCLCALKENEKARLLPNCRHTFHVDCIDMWFLSHINCPLCRTGAQPVQPVLESARIEQVSATISEPITSGIHDNLNSEKGENASSGEEFNMQNPTDISSSGRQKQINAEMYEGTSGGRALMPLTITLPRRPDGFSAPVEAHQPCSPNGSQSSSRSPVTRLRPPNVSQSSSRSPVTRLSSPTRTTSRDRERTPVFPSNDPAECEDENNDQ